MGHSMKLKDFLRQFEGLDPETEILHGSPDDYETYLTSEMKIDDKNCSNPVYKTLYSDMSYDFENGKCDKVIFLV